MLSSRMPEGRKKEKIRIGIEYDAILEGFRYCPPNIIGLSS